MNVIIDYFYLLTIEPLQGFYKLKEQEYLVMISE